MVLNGTGYSFSPWFVVACPARVCVPGACRCVFVDAVHVWFLVETYTLVVQNDFLFSGELPS